MNAPADDREPPTSLPPPPPPLPAEGPELSEARRTWGPARTLAALAAFLAIVTVEAGAVSAFDPDLESLAAKLSLQGLLAITLIAVAFAAAKPGPGLAPPEALGLRRPLRPALWPTFAAYGIYIACALALAALIQPEQEDITRELGVDQGAFEAIAAGLLIVLAAPISEEVFFRGFLFAGVRRRTPFVIAAVLSSAVWGIFHYTGPDSWGVCLQLAIFGVILCWLYERTGSILPTIAVHMFNNALAFALLTS